MSSPADSSDNISKIPAVPDTADLDLPITLSASVLIASLPRDGKLALDKVLYPKAKKVAIKFRAMGAAPALKRETYRIEDSRRFENVAVFLRKQLEIGPDVQLFLYVNLSFAPALDENVGNLWSCFKTNEELVINYSTQSAFG